MSRQIMLPPATEKPSPPPAPPSVVEVLPGIHISPEIVLQGAGAGQGADILNYQAAPTVRNCVITNNHADKGGGAYNMTSAGLPPGPGGPPSGAPGGPAGKSKEMATVRTGKPSRVELSLKRGLIGWKAFLNHFFGD